MEKFRRPLWPDDHRFGASGIGAGGERGHGKGPGTASDRHISQSFANARTSQHSSPFLHTPTSGPRGTGGGMVSFSPALSRASSTMMTPVQQTQQQPGGFSMFGGKAYSTPASHGSISSQPPLSSHTPIDSNTRTVAPGTIPYGSGGSSGVGGGLARFKTLAQETQEEDHKKQQERRGGSGRGNSSGCGIRDSTVRGMPSPSSNFLAPSSLMGSPPNSLTPCDDSPFSSAAYTFTPPSSAAPPSYSNWPTGPSTAAGRKRPRAPSTATAALGRPMTPGTVRSVGGGNLSADVSGARTWGSLAEGSRGRAGQVQQQQQHRQPSPRPTAARGASGAAALAAAANSVSSRSPRPTGKESSPQSPRPSQPSPTPRRYKLDDFAGADDVCFNAASTVQTSTMGRLPPYPATSPAVILPRNSAASSEGLAIFLERCEVSGVASLSVLWADLTTSFSAMTVKSCLPSQSCFRWNCACGRQGLCYAFFRGVDPSPSLLTCASAARTESDTSGCSQEDDFEEGEMYLLPLGACVGEDKEAAEAAGYHLPLDCEVALMPLIAWRRRPESRTFLARSAAAAAEGGSDRDGHEPSVDSSPPPQQQQRQHVSTKHHTTVSRLFDTRVAAWMTDTGKADKALEFEALCVSWLKGEGSDAVHKPDAEGVNARSGDGGRLPAIVAAVVHAEGCCRRNLALAGKISAELEGAKMLAACEQVEMPTVPVLAGMEVSGVVFLPERVTRFSNALGNHLEGLKRTAVKAVGGRDFNLASPDQAKKQQIGKRMQQGRIDGSSRSRRRVASFRTGSCQRGLREGAHGGQGGGTAVADILFKHLKLPSPPLKAGSVHASTSAEVLEGLQGKHAVVAPILEFRGVNKYKTTYVDKLAERALGAAAADSAVPASQGAGATRIHATWNQTSARTGRLSCSRPNLQQANA
ncbi:unnamed protein product [Ectocarpus sp. CCAP 1310/34]|nr:unnamed protein product [Ectocarpus sp. CCAP 1310/34]